MMDILDAHKQGQHAEEHACQYLLTQGLKLLARNYRSFHGEIDLVMQDGDVVVFIEVRARNHTAFGDAIESVTPAKQKKIVKTAIHYLQRHHLLDKVDCRFDIIGLNQPSVTNKIEWIKDAFEVDYF